MNLSLIRFGTDWPMAQCRKNLPAILKSALVKEVRCFVLGPAGTNIELAARGWSQRLDCVDKTVFCLCKTPEASVARAHAVDEPGVISLFWTCAVYCREMDIFFGNPGTYPFFVQENMPLDNMQLATRAELVSVWQQAEAVPAHWKVASHPSPSALAGRLPCRIAHVTSNAQAAITCLNGETELCITTESARRLYGLESLHAFGSPEMVFFGGITGRDARRLQDIWHSLAGAREAFTEGETS